jgi:hypothetical protein
MAQPENDTPPNRVTSATGGCPSAVATRLADLGVLPHVVEAVLNHVSGHKAGVAGVYNRSTYAAEKRGALTLWGVISRR